MNKIFAKFMALALSAAMIVPSVAFATEDVTSVTDADTASVTEEIEVDTFALKEAFYADVTVDDDGFVYSNSADDESRNIIMQSKGDYTFVEGEHANHSATPEYDASIKYCVAIDSDGASTFKKVDGQNTIFTSRYHATNATRAGRYNRQGCINVYVGKAFPYKTASNLVVEYDYYGEAGGRMRFRYANAASGSVVYQQFNKIYDEAQGPMWQTASFELDDFYPDADDTGLGSKIDGKGGSASDASFRIEALDDTAAVKAIRVFTPGYMDLKEAIDSIEIANADEIRDNFEVPVSYGDAEIRWTSENSAISIDADGVATVTRDPKNNISGDLIATAVYGDYYLETVIPATVFTSNEAQAELDDHLASLALGVDDIANVTESFALPVAPDGYEYKWASTNQDYIDVSDGVTAVVNPSKFMESTATIIVTVTHGDKSADAEFELSAPALYKEVKGSEIIADNDGDIQTCGDMSFAGNFTNSVAYDGPQIPVDDDGNPYGAQNAYFISDATADYAAARTTIGKSDGSDVSDAVMSGYAFLPKRVVSGVAGAYLNCYVAVDVGSGFTAEDNEVTIEVEYFDKYANTLSIRYVNGAYGTGSAAGKTWSPNAYAKQITTTGSGEWKTVAVTVKDAYFVEDNKTGMGTPSYADIRIEGNYSAVYVRRVAVYNGEGFREIAAVKDTIEIENVDLANVEDNFELPLSGEGGVEIEWASQDNSIIDIQDGVAYIYPSVDDELTTTLTAAIMKDGVYTTKDFEVTLAKLPKKSPAVGDAVVVTGDTTTNIEYTVEGTGNMRGSELSVMAVITDKATGKIIAKKIATKTVVSDTTVIDVDIQNPLAGQQLTHNVVNEIGAVVKNRAPAALTGVTGKSSKLGGKVVWDAAGDDYGHVVYDVYKDGTLWIEGTEETEAVYETDSTTPSSFYVVARDHEGKATAPSVQVQAARYIAEYYDVDKNNNSTITVKGTSDAYSLDRVTRYTEKTGADTVDGDGVTPVTLKAVTTISGSVRSVETSGLKTGASRMQWRADNIADNETHVVILVKYFDEGTGDVAINYSSLPAGGMKKNGSAFKLTGTNTWKEAAIILEDAAFINASNGVEGDDFFFNTSANNGVLAINKVTVLPYEFY